MKPPLLRAKDAAKLVERCADQLRDLANVRNVNGRASAAAYVFNRMVTALAEAMRGRGSARVAKTYEEWATLANARGSGKQTKAASLRSPFSQWKDVIKEADALSPSPLPVDADARPTSKTIGDVACKFSIITPDERGKRGGVAGLCVQFVHRQGEVGIRPPATIAEVLPIDQELARIAEDVKREAELAGLRKSYLAKFSEWWGADEARKAEKALRKREVTTRARWMNRAAIWVVAVLIVAVTGTSLYAAYREQRERLRRMFGSYSLSMDGDCNRATGQPFNRMYFVAPGAQPPFVILRDGEPIGTIEEAPDERGGYQYEDPAVEEGRAYVYSVGQKVWGLGMVTTPSFTIRAKLCRRPDNSAPVVGRIHTSPATPRVGEPFEAWVDAFDPDGDPLTFHWMLWPELQSLTGQRIRSVIRVPGLHPFTVTVSDGKEPTAYANESIGISAMNPNNRPPVLPMLVAAPQRVRPGQSVSFVAPATDPDDDVLQYEWNFDQEKWMTERTFRRTDITYDAPGTYHPSVTVIDSSLATTRAHATVEVAVDARPPTLTCAGIVAEPRSPAIGAPVVFRVDLSPGSAVPRRVLWDFGDGSPLTVTRSLTATHRFPHGVFGPTAVLEVSTERAVCAGMHVVIGEPPALQSSSLPVRGTVTPTRGTTATRFTFVATPPGTPQEYEYRWEMSNRRNAGPSDGVILDTDEWLPDNTYTCQLPQEGIWEIAYIARRRDGSGQEVHTIDHVTVWNPPAATARPRAVQPPGTH